MKSQKKKDFQMGNYKVPTINPEHPGSADAPHPSASVANAVLTDLSMLQKDLAAQKNDYIRLAADFDNFQKRTRRDSEQQAAVEKETFIRDLLPILDNLELAMASEQSISSELLHQGVTMTLQQIGQLLHRHGIEAVEDIGKPFDPHRHEAVSVWHDPRQPDQTILEVIQRGYYRNDKIFRPAKVVVNDLSHSPGGNHAR
ncbi:MAG: nucleotide exchange factor GrpE [Planctomycetaceae bacterium]|nr:nucleotide exchange factor GrpE [Planctomycetaceae bacterium]